ncbi:decaprenyl-phosphate phosphoribosyltransferase [bacterium]|nr:decaprenyl-phosphate phosphoribosyltransferase [bacterium]
MQTLRGLITTLRPHQWTKNTVLFAGLIFAGGLSDPGLVWLAVQGAAIFCLLSGAVYVLNDIADLKSDRLHPEKRKRPLASGSLSVGLSAGVGVIAAVGGLLWAYAIFPTFGHTAIGFLMLNILYSLALRRMVILDVVAIAIGFVLRAVGSVEVLRGVAPDTELSPWLLVCTFFLALFMGLGKRRAEVLTLGDTAAGHRETLEHYPANLVDLLMGVVTAATVVSYTIYTIWPGTVAKVGGPGLVYTVPFVVYGLFRYLYLVFAAGKGGKPSRLLVTDTPMVVSSLLWVVVVIWVLYTA